MKKQVSFRKIILKVHEILGLSTGLIVFIVAITGCCWAFKDEIESLYSDHKKVIVQDNSFISPSKAKEIAQAIFPDKRIHGSKYGKKDEALEVIFYQPDPEFYQTVFLNPYSGKVIHIEDHESGFFHFVLEGHMMLWLPDEIGSKIVSYGVLLFTIILISGFILWWPKNRNGRKQRLTFSWKKNTGWKRKNFDLHAITGFYIYSLAFILAFTGCIMAFDWFKKLVYNAAGGDKVTEFAIPNNISAADYLQDKNQLPMDQLIAILQKEDPDVVAYEIHYPHSDSSAIYVELFKKDGVYYNSDYRFFDQYTLKEISSPTLYGTYKEASLADKMILMNYDIHVGAIGGLPGKLIAFLVSLCIASLPVTGFILWLGRRKMKKSITRTGVISNNKIKQGETRIRKSADNPPKKKVYTTE